MGCLRIESEISLNTGRIDSVADTISSTTIDSNTAKLILSVIALR